MKSNNRTVINLTSLLKTQIDGFLKSKLHEIGNKELVPSYGALLWVVYRHSGRVQIKTIYETLLNQKSSITEKINRLVKLGYLKKEACQEDKRVTYVIATEKALSFQNDYNLISLELVDRLFKNFTEEEIEQLIRLMTKAIKNIT